MDKIARLQVDPINHTMISQISYIGRLNVQKKQLTPIPTNDSAQSICFFRKREKMTQTGTLSIATVKELASAGAVTSVRLVAEAGGFEIFIQCGQLEKVLQAKRGHIRRFMSLDRAVAFLQELGFSRMEVDVSNWERRRRRL